MRGYVYVPIDHSGTLSECPFKALIIKDGYWRWPERDLAGNAIDFGMKVLKLSFHDTMREIIHP